MHRRTSFAKRHVVRIYKPHGGESEIAHGACSGADVEGIASGNQDDPRITHDWIEFSFQSAQAAVRGTRQTRNSADLAAAGESVVREFIGRALLLKIGITLQTFLVKFEQPAGIFITD